MRVDVLDWHASSESFRQVIERDYVVVQESDRRNFERRLARISVRDVSDPITLKSIFRKPVLDIGPMACQTGPFGRTIPVHTNRRHQSVSRSDHAHNHLEQSYSENRITPQDVPCVSDHDRDTTSKVMHLRQGDIVFSRVGSV